MQTVIFKMEPFGCPSCVQQIEKVLNDQNGVKNVKIKFHSNKININFDQEQVEPQQLEQILTKIGYPVLESKVSISK